MTDVYVLMFLADTVDFIVIVFGFWAFGVDFGISWGRRSQKLRLECIERKCARFSETLCSRRHHFLPFGGPGSRGVLGHGSDPVWYVSPSLHPSGCGCLSPLLWRVSSGTMVIDRALYLRKTVLGKLVFQVILVLGIHFWMFFILPTVTERYIIRLSNAKVQPKALLTQETRVRPSRRFNHNLVAQLWYFVKCIYFGLSAYQIRSGYPTRVLGNFLTKSYNYLNLFLFQGQVAAAVRHLITLALALARDQVDFFCPCAVSVWFLS